MAEGEHIQATEEQSIVLDEGEITQTVSGEESTEEVQLPSDTTEFVMPDKFTGKSAEEIAKSYIELEKMQSKAVEEEGGTAPQGEESPEGDEEPPGEVELTEEQYSKYSKSLEDNGTLSDEEYSELEKLGYDKATVDKEVSNYKEQKEFQKYKQEKTLNEIIEPLGGGKEKFKAVAAWSKETKTSEEVAAINNSLSNSPKAVQQAILKGLYAEYDSSGNTLEGPIHSNTPTNSPSKGYSSQEEFFKDIGSPEYQNNPKFREAVDTKMSKSNIF